MNFADEFYGYGVPGMVRLELGDLVDLPQGGKHIIVKVNESGAIAQPLAKRHQVITDKFTDETKEFDAPGRRSRISRNLPQENIVNRGGEAALKEFLEPKSLRSRMQPNDDETNNTNDGDKTMATKPGTSKLRKLKGEIKPKARGGLAAEAAADKAPAKAKKSEQPAGEGKGRGRTSEQKDYIWSQLDGTKTKQEIAACCVDKFGAKMEIALKRVNDAPFYMRKAGLKPAWKEVTKEPAAK